MWFYLFIFYYQKASSAGRDFIWFMLLRLCPAESSCSTNMCGVHEGVKAQRCQCPVLPNAVPQRRVPSPPLSLSALCFGIRPCVPPWEEKGKQDSLFPSGISSFHAERTHLHTGFSCSSVERSPGLRGAETGVQTLGVQPFESVSSTLKWQ